MQDKIRAVKCLVLKRSHVFAYLLRILLPQIVIFYHLQHLHFCFEVFFTKKKLVKEKLVVEERTTTVSSLHFLYVNSKFGRQHTRCRWQPLSVQVLLMCMSTVSNCLLSFLKNCCSYREFNYSKMTEK